MKNFSVDLKILSIDIPVKNIDKEISRVRMEEKFVEISSQCVDEDGDKQLIQIAYLEFDVEDLSFTDRLEVLTVKDILNPTEDELNYLELTHNASIVSKYKVLAKRLREYYGE